MYLKTIILTVFLMSNLSSNMLLKLLPVDFNIYPIPKKLAAKSHGGELPDKIAATDGIGTIVLGAIGSSNGTINNKVFNKLLYNNLSKLDNNKTINDLLLSNKLSINSFEENILKKNRFNQKFPEGSNCDDGNNKTLNDKIVNGICTGTPISQFTKCNDNNINTYNDVIVDGVCKGIPLIHQNFTICGNNDNTIWLNDECKDVTSDQQFCYGIYKKNKDGTNNILVDKKCIGPNEKASFPQISFDNPIGKKYDYYYYVTFDLKWKSISKIRKNNLNSFLTQYGNKFEIFKYDNDHYVLKSEKIKSKKIQTYLDQCNENTGNCSYNSQNYYYTNGSFPLRDYKIIGSNNNVYRILIHKFNFTDVNNEAGSVFNSKGLINYILWYKKRDSASWHPYNANNTIDLSNAAYDFMVVEYGKNPNN